MHMHRSSQIFLGALLIVALSLVGALVHQSISRSRLPLRQPVSSLMATSVVDEEPAHLERAPSVLTPTESVFTSSTGDLAPSTTTTHSTTTPQYVLLSFDGSRSIPFWKASRAFAQQMKDQGKPLHFTYFVSGVYFLTPSNKQLYQPPSAPPGTSTIGWGDSSTDIENRLEQMNRAVLEGHEIASHANGHFSGASWSTEDWRKEFSAFDGLMRNVADNNRLTGTSSTRTQLQFLSQGNVNGFRAPELGVSPGLWNVEKEFGMRYDASQTRKMTDFPTKKPQGMWSISLARIPFATTTQAILSMDYNFYFKQSGAKDVAKKGSPEWQMYYDEMLQSYRAYFRANYDGPRSPVVIGHHFSLWNDGVYWEVMKQFASEVCGQPDVKCVTFSEYSDYLDKIPRK